MFLCKKSYLKAICLWDSSVFIWAECILALFLRSFFASDIAFAAVIACCRLFRRNSSLMVYWCNNFLTFCSFVVLRFKFRLRRARIARNHRAELLLNCFVLLLSDFFRQLFWLLDRNLHKCLGTEICLLNGLVKDPFLETVLKVF